MFQPIIRRHFFLTNHIFRFYRKNKSSFSSLSQMQLFKWFYWIHPYFLPSFHTLKVRHNLLSKQRASQEQLNISHTRRASILFSASCSFQLLLVAWRKPNHPISWSSDYSRGLPSNTGEACSSRLVAECRPY